MKQPFPLPKKLTCPLCGQKAEARKHLFGDDVLIDSKGLITYSHYYEKTCSIPMFNWAQIACFHNFKVKWNGHRWKPVSKVTVSSLTRKIIES